MTVRRELRFAVGSRKGPRSTIWKVWVAGDNIYLSSRMFASHMKVSLHATGECQWSRTDSWVTEVPGRRNAERHITKWNVVRPEGIQSLHLFRVLVPVSEVRDMGALKDKKKVMWVEGAPMESTIAFDLYLTMPADADPADGRQFEMRHLASLPTRDGRWLVVFANVLALNPLEISAVRIEIADRLRSAGHQPMAEHRSAAFMKGNEGAPNGLLELCPI